MRFTLVLSLLLTTVFSTAKFDVIQEVADGCNVDGKFDTTRSGTILIKCTTSLPNAGIDFSLHNPSLNLFRAVSTFGDNCVDGTVDKYFGSPYDSGNVYDAWVNLTAIPCSSKPGPCCIYVQAVYYGVFYYHTRLYARPTTSASASAGSTAGLVVGLIIGISGLFICAYYWQRRQTNALLAKATQTQIQQNPIVIGDGEPVAGGSFPMQPVQTQPVQIKYDYTQTRRNSFNFILYNIMKALTGLR